MLCLWQVYMGIKSLTEGFPSWVLWMWFFVPGSQPDPAVASLGLKITKLSRFLARVWGGLPDTVASSVSCGDSDFLQGLEMCVFQPLLASRHLARPPVPPSPRCFMSGSSPSCPADPLGQGLLPSVALRSKLQDDVF